MRNNLTHYFTCVCFSNYLIVERDYRLFFNPIFREYHFRLVICIVFITYGKNTEHTIDQYEIVCDKLKKRSISDLIGTAKWCSGFYRLEKKRIKNRDTHRDLVYI